MAKFLTTPKKKGFLCEATRDLYFSIPTWANEAPVIEAYHPGGTFLFSFRIQALR
jgi:hypothetical protein